jgi:hypothetical protein
MTYTDRVIQNYKDAVKTWWNNLGFEQRFYKTIEANSVLNGDTVDNHPDRLTDEDIEKVFEWHVRNAKN